MTHRVEAIIRLQLAYANVDEFVSAYFRLFQPEGVLVLLSGRRVGVRSTIRFELLSISGDRLLAGEGTVVKVKRAGVTPEAQEQSLPGVGRLVNAISVQVNRVAPGGREVLRRLLDERAGGVVPGDGEEAQLVPARQDVLCERDAPLEPPPCVDGNDGDAPVAADDVPVLAVGRCRPRGRSGLFRSVFSRLLGRRSGRDRDLPGGGDALPLFGIPVAREEDAPRRDEGREPDTTVPPRRDSIGGLEKILASVGEKPTEG